MQIYEFAIKPLLTPLLTLNPVLVAFLMNFYFCNHLCDVSFVWLILSYLPALIIVYPALCFYGFTTILEAKNVAHKSLYLHETIQQVLFSSNFFNQL